MRTARAGASPARRGARAGGRDAAGPIQRLDPRVIPPAAASPLAGAALHETGDAELGKSTPRRVAKSLQARAELTIESDFSGRRSDCSGRTPRRAPSLPIRTAPGRAH